MNKFASAITPVLVLLLFSCSDKETEAISNPVKADTVPTTTVMLYGCAGGNLDEALVFNLDQALAYKSNGKTNFTALVKFSKPLQAEPDKKGTRRFTKVGSDMTNEQVADSTFRLDNPENLANFINESTEKFPADNYVLVFWDHGCEFGDADVPYGTKSYTNTRSLLRDDNTGRQSMSIFEMAEALRRAKKHVNLLYWDVCMMNCMENLYEIKDYTDYVMAAGNPTPGCGGNYAQLLNSLETKTSLQAALKDYVPKAASVWQESSVNTAADLCVCDMSKIEPVAEDVKDFGTYMMNLRKSTNVKTKALYLYLNSITNDKDAETGTLTPCNYNSGGALFSYFAGDGRSVDLKTAAVRYATFLNDGKLSAIASRMENDIRDLIVTNVSGNMPDYVQYFSPAIIWDDSAHYNKYPIASNYTHLKWEAATNWNEFLKENRMFNRDSCTAGKYDDLFIEGGLASMFEQKGTLTMNTADTTITADIDIVMASILVVGRSLIYPTTTSKDLPFLNQKTCPKLVYDSSTHIMVSDENLNMPVTSGVFSGYVLNKIALQSSDSPYVITLYLTKDGVEKTFTGQIMTSE